MRNIGLGSASRGHLAHFCLWQASPKSFQTYGSLPCAILVKQPSSWLLALTMCVPTNWLNHSAWFSYSRLSDNPSNSVKYPSVKSVKLHICLSDLAHFFIYFTSKDN